MTVRRTANQSGFTLIELMLALTFISFLMVFIVTSVLQLTRTYNKGLSVRQINQVGRQIGDDLNRNLRYAKTPVYLSIAQRLCTGTVSYVWNTSSSAFAQNKFNVAPTELKLARVNDSGGAMCVQVAGVYPVVQKAVSQELLGPLVVLSGFSVRLLENDSVTDFTYVLSTGGVNEPGYEAVGDRYFCNPDGADNEFCAFGQFKSAVYSRKFGVE